MLRLMAHRKASHGKQGGTWVSIPGLKQAQGQLQLIMVIIYIEFNKFLLCTRWGTVISKAATLRKEQRTSTMTQIKKTASFAVLHFMTAFGVAWAITGSMLVGGAVAVVEPAINTVVYFLHEKVWQRRSTNPAPRLVC